MKLKKTIDELVQQGEPLGLLKLQVKHKVASSCGTAHYLGPYMDPKEWQQVLAFFKWTNDEHHSESQVRMYVNIQAGRVAFWAHPQEMSTGMSARELTLELEERKEDARKRYEFWDSEPSADWVYFGTIHHHCNAGAFQSSTDEDNEKNQDGLHITVGNVGNSDGVSLHCRFYHNKLEFEPDMAEFWDIGEPWKNMPPDVLNWNRLALMQMASPPPEDILVPKQWMENVKEAPKITHTSRGLGYSPNHDDTWGFMRGSPVGNYGYRTIGEKLEEFQKDFDRLCMSYNMEFDEALDLMEELQQPFVLAIMRAVRMNDVDFDDAIKHAERALRKDMEEMLEQEEKMERQAEEADNKKLKVIPKESKK